MYANASIWKAMILAGIAGCIMTAIFANSLKGVPFGAVAGNIWKHVWSIIFVIPVPFLLGFGATGIGLFLAFLWLMLAPTIASKVHFGPKDVPAMVLNAFHAGYAVAALFVLALVNYLVS